MKPVFNGTVIGNSCLIGDGVSITDAHLWDNVTIVKMVQSYAKLSYVMTV